jgi:hypothetical protein
VAWTGLRRSVDLLRIIIWYICSLHNGVGSHLTFAIQVLDATDTNDTHWIIRIARVAKSEALSEEHLSWPRDKVRREAEMMKWMSTSKKIPVPQVVAVNDGVADQHMPYMYRTLIALTGCDHPLGKNIQSYAEIAVVLFNTSAPPGIGSLLCLDKATTVHGFKPLLGPIIFAIRQQ